MQSLNALLLGSKVSFTRVLLYLILLSIRWILWETDEKNLASCDRSGSFIIDRSITGICNDRGLCGVMNDASFRLPSENGTRPPMIYRIICYYDRDIKFSPHRSTILLQTSSVGILKP